MRATSNDPGDALLDPLHFDPLTNRAFLVAAKEMLLANDDHDGLFALNNAIMHAVEHSIGAAQKFVAGDIPGAIELWNMRPGRPDSERYVSATQHSDGTWGLMQANGVRADLDPKDMRAWLEWLQRVMLRCAVRTSPHLQ